MWNLLGGFAGLISVGQQAYIGIGAYGLWLLRRRASHPAVRRRLPGRLSRRRRRAARRAAAVPSARRLLRHRHVGDRRGRACSSSPTSRPPAAVPARPSSRPRTCRSTRRMLRGHYWMALGVAVGSILLVFFLLRSKRGSGAHVHPRQRHGRAELGRQRLSLQADRVRHRRLRLRRRGGRRGPQPAAHPAGGGVQPSTGRPTPLSSSSSAASAASRARSSARSSTSRCCRR